MVPQKTLCVVFFCYSYATSGYKVVTVEAKNNISANPAQLNYSMNVTVDIDIEVKLHPEPTVSGDLVISTNENFETTVSTSIDQEVTFTFKFSQNSIADLVRAKGRTKKTHKYETEGNFTVEITANVKWGSGKYSFVVIVRACGPPSLLFPDKYALDDPQVTTKAMASFQLEPRVTKNSCNKGTLDFHWKMTSWKDNETLSCIESYKRVFPIDPKGLEPRDYNISLNAEYVEYVENKNVTTKYSFKTYMRVKRSDLVAVIKGGSLRQIDKNSSERLTLDAAESYDPDNPGSDGLTFKWHCKFETKSNKSLSSDHCNSSRFVSLRASGNGSPIFNISEFLENVNYIFKVTIKTEDGRSASVTQAVKIILDIPSLVIR